VLAPQGAVASYPSDVALRSVIPAYRLLFALLTIAAIITLTASLISHGIFDLGGFFSVFTIDSSLIAAALLLVGAAMWRSTPPPVMDLLRGAGVVYMTVTAVVFTLLLSRVDVETRFAWVNNVVHELMPLVILADWFIAPPASRLAMRKGALWLLPFPVVWIVYTLIRGAASGLYPYPFLDPANGGYGSVALYCVGILVFMLLVCAVIVWLGNLRPPAKVAEHAA
jgi:hypothetical protein